MRAHCAPAVTGFSFAGIDRARPNPYLIKAVEDDPKAIIIVPSNPYVSVDPILKLPGLRAALKAAGKPVVAVSPIVGVAALKGPTAKTMEELGRDVSGLGIAEHYRGLIDGLIIDTQEADLASTIEDMRIATLTTRSVMTDVASRIALAEFALEFATRLRR